MINSPAYRIFPLGDSALTIDFGNVINEALNKKVLALFDALQKNPLTGMIEAVPAYSSLTLYYDLVKMKKQLSQEKTVYEQMKEELGSFLSKTTFTEEKTGRLVSIPVCYETAYAANIQELAAAKKIPVEEIIRIHTARTYRVYMLGFLPGFAYMGEVDDRISFPRKQQPEPVAAGSVGIAGKQTGIYPLASPGGWCIIGKTPLALFDAPEEGETLLKAGDMVQFISISKDEFEGYQSRRS